MTQTIGDVMTRDPYTLDHDESVTNAAKVMRDHHIGDVLVTDGERVCGIVTDRDIAVRAVAQGGGVATMKLGDICNHDLTTIAPTTSLVDAMRLMREKALRRLPVVVDERAVGIVSIGDLARKQDPSSALADISEAPPNS